MVKLKDFLFVLNFNNYFKVVGTKDLTIFDSKEVVDFDIDFQKLLDKFGDKNVLDFFYSTLSNKMIITIGG